MANPQLEDGFIRISREFWRALRRFYVPGQPRRMLDFIIEKTWGWGKKEDSISLSQFAEALGINKKTVSKHKTTLLSLNIISTRDPGPLKGGRQSIIYRVNKDFETWRGSPLRGTVPFKGKRESPLKGKKESPCRGTTIDTITKDNLQKREVYSLALSAKPKTPEQIFSDLKLNPAYSHIDFNREYGKMLAWQRLPSNRHRKITERFILRWINKIDPPITPGPEPPYLVPNDVWEITLTRLKANLEIEDEIAWRTVKAVGKEKILNGNEGTVKGEFIKIFTDIKAKYGK